MASENAKKIIDTILVTLPSDSIPSDVEIRELAERLRAIFPINDEDFDFVIKKLHSRLPITMDVGSAVVAEDHQSWLLAKKPDIIPYYWDRFEKFLIKDGWTPSVTKTLDRVTDEILDMLGNPNRSGMWKRRGLVMGDVQSGKTSTYTALSCKASDAGYRLIILLTGTLENLRRQTQERLDSGFVGLDSSGILSQQRQTKLIGTGMIDNNRTPGVFTSIKTDFKSDLINQLGFRLDSFREPILVVVKKNKRILENLENWLRSYNANANGLIDTPLLLIDDEADNASVNTTANGNEPTAINRGIRSLLRLFTRSAYVGFTATPFANIFIDPETEHEMFLDDLFPRDFIYSLEAPSHYIGADSIFTEEGRASSCLKIIEDADAYFPTPHRSTLEVDDLPESLGHALLAFILANAIRDLRNEGATHRSMLVNVSRFTNVQEQVTDLLDIKLRLIQQDIRSYSQLSPIEAIQNITISNLYDIWMKEYEDREFTWEVVLKSLLKAALPIVVRSVNQKRGAASLDYKAHKEDGLRVVAVGGNSLSRGLTLEGLSISYFYRNSQMYDTLMQMARWFGYREDYDDLCRVWMTEEAIHWYSHIGLATRELRNEIRKMQHEGLTPREFGLKVRAHPDSLIVTARNKMRSARTIERLISVSEQGLETPRLHTDASRIKANALAVERLILALSHEGFTNEPSEYSGNNIWKSVPKKHVINLLREFTIHPLNLHFQGDNIASFLERSNEEKLDKWDIVIPNGSSNSPKRIVGIEYKSQQRTVEKRGNGKYILVSGSKARVGSRGVEREGIDSGNVQSITEHYKRINKNVSDKVYREIRERPLLLLHIIDAYFDKENQFQTEDPLIALGLSFPKFDDRAEQTRVTYKVNTTEWRNMFEEEEDDDVDVEELEL